MHVLGPLFDIQRSELSADFYYCTSLDSGRWHVNLGPGAVSGYATVEQVESKRMNLHRDVYGKPDDRFEAEYHGARTRLHDLGFQEPKRRFIDDMLGDSGDTHEEASMVISTLMYRE